MLKLYNEDIIVSRVRTYRKGIGWIDDYNNSLNAVGTKALYVIREVLQPFTKEYIYAILRSDFFIEQILSFQTRGMYPRLDKDTAKFVLIPNTTDNIIEQIYKIVRKQIKNERVIRDNYCQMINNISTELLNNQNKSSFSYQLPSLIELSNRNRINAAFFDKYFKQNEFLITNYNKSHRNIFEWGFTISRGQNLQVSAIGESIYRKEDTSNFYRLILPKNLSLYGTVNEFLHLGNPKKLKTLKTGDIIFGAEGFEKGRSSCNFRG